MKIDGFHIENFGKFSDFTLTLQEPFSCFCYENGWGKSTLVAFIRVMFYGFEGEKKRKHNERAEYRPWQGGVYGGQLDFTYRGIPYEMTRIFGNKESEDSFELRNRMSNLPSSDFSSSIGREIFDIDSDAFMRTMLIGQNNCFTEVTGEINAKIGNLTADSDDMNYFEKACLSLKEYLNRNSPTKKTGTIFKWKEELASLQLGLYRKEGLLRGIEAEKEERKKCKEKIRQCKAEQEEIVQKQRRVSHQKEEQKLQEKYRDILQRYEESLQKWEAEKAVFTNRIPDKKELEEKIHLCSRLNEQKGAMAAALYTEEEQQEWIRLSEKYGESEGLVEKVSSLQEKWLERNRKMQALSVKKNNFIQEKKTADQNRRTLLKKQKAKRMGGSFLGLFLLLLGIFCIFINEWFGLFVAVVAILLIIFSLFGKSKKRVGKEGEEQQQLRILEKEIKKEEECIARVDQEMKAFFTQLGISFQETTASRYLSDFMKEAVQFRFLKQRQRNGQGEQEAYFKNKKILEKWIQELGFEPSDSIQEQLFFLQEQLNRYLQAKERLEEEKNRKDCFERENPHCNREKWQPVTDTDDWVVLNQQFEKKHKEGEELFKQLKVSEERLEELLEEQDAVFAEEEQYESLKEKVEEKMLVYERVKKTQEFLIAAKENITAKYRDPLLRNYLQIRQAFTGEENEKINMDANANVTVVAYGKQREMESFSTGYQDLNGLCLRFALIKAMYPDEKPMVILDDPFVNLDEEKGKGGIELLKKLSQEFQIIYFSCHKSRI